MSQKYPPRTNVILSHSPNSVPHSTPPIIMSPVPVLLCLAIAAVQLIAAYPLDEDLQNTLFELGYIDLSQYGRTIFGEPDNSTGELLANFNANSTQNPEELGSYLEGDILMPIGQARNGLSANAARWPNAIVPYEIRGSFGKKVVHMA